jgi:hypothetical protein
VHLVGFIISICHDARSHERKIYIAEYLLLFQYSQTQFLQSKWQQCPFSLKMNCTEIMHLFHFFVYSIIIIIVIVNINVTKLLPFIKLIHVHVYN